MTSLKLCSHREYNDMFFFCLSINDKRTKEQNSVTFQSIILQNWNSGGDSLEKFPFKAHSHSAKLPLHHDGASGKSFKTVISDFIFL